MQHGLENNFISIKIDGNEVINDFMYDFFYIRIVEGKRFTFPIIELAINDQGYTIIEKYTLTNKTSFEITLGIDTDYQEIYKCRYFNISDGILSGLYKQGLLYSISLVPEYYYQLIISEIKGYDGTPSDVATTIASSLKDVKIGNIEETKENFSIIQPGWNKIQMLSLLCEMAQSTKEHFGYYAYIDRSNNFNFCTDQLFYNQSFKHELQQGLNPETEEDKLKFFYNVNIKMDHGVLSDLAPLGKAYGWLLKDRIYLEKDIIPSNTNIKSLSNYLMYTDENLRKIYNNGTLFDESYLGDYALHDLTTVLTQGITITIEVVFNKDYMIGDKFKIYFNNIEGINSTEILDSLSGQYIISEMSHLCVRGKPIRTRIDFTREGFDNKLIESALKAPLGKAPVGNK